MWVLRVCTIAAGVLFTAQFAQANAISTSPRPPAKVEPQNVSFDTRPPVRAQNTSQPKTVASDAGLQRWIEDFKPRAAAMGITPDVLDNAFRGVTYDAKVIKRDRNQSEFTKTIWDYLGTAVSDLRIKNGKAALRKHADTFAKVEAKYGVEKEVIAAIWGLESAYGTFRGSDSVIRSLATLAYDGRRGEFFEGELIAALKILQNGDTSAREMTGSWAGAMGHTQFIPTSFLAHAVDFDGDGRRNIWSDDPRDAVASTAAYLVHFGWQKGVPWGVEIKLPPNFDYILASREILKTPQEWANLGVVGMHDDIKNFGPASVLLPAGGDGAAFMVFANFEVLESYNTADAYVVGVGHLSDRITGGPAIKSGWPYDDRALTLDERLDMQRRLTAKGFDTQKIDGKIGPLTINAVRAYQLSEGLRPDGYASPALVNRLRR
jgi:lytic murein transglycosylase